MTITPTSTPQPRPEQRRDQLFDYAVAHPDGFTIDDLTGDTGWNRRDANAAIHDLREYLGTMDDINLPCSPNGYGQRWIYRLVGTMADTHGWTKNRLGDTETRLRTMNSMTASIVRGTDGRSTEGRKARLIETGLRHLVEDLDNIAI